jgi:hypothetical protein
LLAEYLAGAMGICWFLGQKFYGGKMIEIEKQYKLKLTENQARQLYNLLQSAKSQNQFTYGSQYDDLRELHNELKGLFDNGIR